MVQHDLGHEWTCTLPVYHRHCLWIRWTLSIIYEPLCAVIFLDHSSQRRLAQRVYVCTSPSTCKKRSKLLRVTMWEMTKDSISSMHTIMSWSNVLNSILCCILSTTTTTRTAHWSNPSPSWDIYVTTLQQRPIPPLSELFWAGPWGGCQCGKQTFFPVHGMLLMR